jgi:hypothetical protein
VVVLAFVKEARGAALDAVFEHGMEHDPLAAHFGESRRMDVPGPQVFRQSNAKKAGDAAHLAFEIVLEVAIVHHQGTRPVVNSPESGLEIEAAMERATVCRAANAGREPAVE